MSANLARLFVRYRRLVLVGAVVFMAIAGGIGGSVASKLSNGGFNDPTAESTTTEELIDKTFGAGTPNLVLLVTAQSGSVDSKDAAAAGQALTKELSETKSVSGVASYWSLQAPPLKSTDGKQALVLARIIGSENEVRNIIEELSPRFTRNESGAAISVAVTGEAETFRQIGTTIEGDLQRAETLALPITLLLLILVFRGLIAAALPLLVGALTVLGTFLVLTGINALTPVSIFALNLTTALGLGLAIDYALFIISRYREELADGWSVHDAVVRSVRTAGRTVLFSAGTVAISLSSLLVFRQPFLRSFAYAGVAVAALAAAASVIVLPAVLAMLGTRIDSFRIGGKRNQRRTAANVEQGFWHRTALAVMRRPGRIAISGVAALVLLGVPFVHINLGLSDHRVLPAQASARKALDTISTNFGSRENGASEVLVQGLDSQGSTPDLKSYAGKLSQVQGVARVDSTLGSFIGGQLVAPPNPSTARFAPKPIGTQMATWLSVVPAIEPVSPAGETLAKALRAVDSPFATTLSGPSAQLVDSKHSLFNRMPYAGLVIAVTTFVLLFLMFGGLLVPIKALLLNMLSLTATFGAMVWIFQDGHLSKFFDFTATGTIDGTMPILMFCIAFGLSMDYEVFLLSRIKEEHDRHGDNTRAVAVGLEKTGRIVTAAGLLIAVVFIAFATSGISFIKMFGLGLAIAVLMDAFVIRATLVPAFMRLAGEANWWAPAPLRRLQQRIGLSEHVELEELDMQDERSHNNHSHDGHSHDGHSHDEHRQDGPMSDTPATVNAT
jgi:putative drug exporter of the RND superfamily